MGLIFSGFLEEDEQILKVFRTPIFFISRSFILRACIWGTIIFGFWFFYPAYNFEKKVWFDLNYIWQGLLVIGALHTLAPFCYWYVNALIMTNESLIIIDWPKLFIRKSTRIDFHNLDEITVERLGFKSFVLNYGNILLTKVNGGGEHMVKKISSPRKVSRTIEGYRETHLDRKNFTEESALKGLISSMVQRNVKVDGQPDRVVYENPNPVQVIREETGRPKKRFHKKSFNDLDDTEVEKRLDDTGGIDLDLDD